MTTLNLIQLISGTATFAEPERTVSEAVKGVVVSMPEGEWIANGCPVAIEASYYLTTYANVEKVAVEPEGKPERDPRSFYL